ncbi:MAG TPA: hypothetical protein VLA93_07760 [Pyrinomonadaceae bacterium]|nr:hypothetical protein [Pyrinomonadaceae bacterium]
MREYLIRADDDEEFDIPFSKWAEVLRPRSYPSKVIKGWGLLRLEVLGCEVSFSPEPPGTQIVFESGEIEPNIADAIVREIVESAESFTGQKGKIVPLQ